MPPILSRFFAREALPLALVAFYAAVLAGLAQFELVGDSWLTLVSGREVVQHGLPQHDQLMTLSHGARWIDQQWLAQVVFYELAHLGGIQAAVLLHVLLLAGAFAIAVVAARRRGASPTTVLWVGLACVFLAPWAWQLRAQSFAYPLFAATLWLLSADSRAPSRRVLLVLPILAVWANLHGSVVLGAGLVALRGLTIVYERGATWRLRAGCLLCAPLLALASPYGTALLGYYRHMLGSPLLSRFVQEWGPTTPAKAWFFYPMAVLVVWLLGRNGAALTLFERAALLATTLTGFVALRHVVWFGLAALMFLPVLLDARRGRTESVQRLARPVGAFAALCLLAIPVVLGTAPASWYGRELPTEATTRLERATRAPGTTVFASETLSDWLLWQAPSLRGRIAYDVRFELLSVGQLDRLTAYHRRSGSDWAAPTLPFSILVLDRRVDSQLIGALRARTGMRTVFSDRRVVILRQASASPSRRAFYKSKVE